MTPLDGQTASPESLTVTVVDLRNEADGVRTVVLRSDTGVLPPWEPGAHVELDFPNGLTRQYSLCSSPTDNSVWRVSVLREAVSRGGSAYVHNGLNVGDTLVARGPRNHFHLVEADSYLFIAGGIGITPLIPMIEKLVQRDAPWRLLYGGRSRSTMAYLQHLSAYGERVVVWPADELGFLDLAQALEQAGPGTAVYSCGPAPMLDALEELSRALPERRLYMERFRPSDVKNAPDTGFEVHLVQSGVRLMVSPGQSIIEAADAAGIALPSSCGEGTCGSCEVEVVEGRPDHRDSFLSDSERAAGDLMMACCSRSQDPVLVLNA